MSREPSGAPALLSPLVQLFLACIAQPNILSLYVLRTLFRLVLYALSYLESSESVHLNRRMMNKHVGTPFFGCNETKTFYIVEQTRMPRMVCRWRGARRGGDQGVARRPPPLSGSPGCPPGVGRGCGSWRGLPIVHQRPRSAGSSAASMIREKCGGSVEPRGGTISLMIGVRNRGNVEARTLCTQFHLELGI